MLNKTATRAPLKFNKETCKRELQKLKFKLEELQNTMYAESKQALLVVLQGMDASGKDGIIKNVFNAVNPMGCRVISFKAPSPIEIKHDFLWRIHQYVPEHGMIHVFNRSHYEDVIVQRVHKWVDQKTITQRFDHINNFEKLLKESGTVVIKFYLHVSKKEQLKRLEERMSDPSKMWKHNDNDIKERGLWNEYMKSYQDVFKNCSVHTPWNIIPSDQNWYKEFLVAKKVVETLQALDMKYPGFKAK